MSTFCVCTDGEDYPLGGDEFSWSSVRHGIAREVAHRIGVPTWCVDVTEVDWDDRSGYASVALVIKAPISREAAS